MQNRHSRDDVRVIGWQKKGKRRKGRQKRRSKGWKQRVSMRAGTKVVTMTRVVPEEHGKPMLFSSNVK